MMAVLASLALLLAGAVTLWIHRRIRRVTLRAWGRTAPELPPGRELLTLLLPVLAVASLGMPGNVLNGPPESLLWLIVDVSRSMGVRDEPTRPEATRLDVARSRLALALAGQGSREIGIVVFGDEARVALPPTPDREALARALEALSVAPKDVGGGSDPGRALALVRIGIPSDRKAEAWLATDGEFHGRFPEQAIRALAPRLEGARLFHVGTRTAAIVPGPDGKPWLRGSRPALSRADPTTAERLRRGLGAVPATSGEHRPAFADWMRAAVLAGCLLLWTRPASLRPPWKGTAVPLVASMALLGWSWPSLPDIWAGQDAWQRGHVEAAARAFRRATLREDPHPVAYFDLGTAELALGRLDHARRELTRAERNTKAGSSLRAAAAYNLGIAEALAGRWPEAAEAFRRAVAFAPGDADARHNLAVAEAHLKTPPRISTSATFARETAAALQRDRQPPPSSGSTVRGREGGGRTTPDW